jgi:hypothetical protein
LINVLLSASLQRTPSPPHNAHTLPHFNTLLPGKIDRLLRPNHDVEGGGLLDIVFSLSNYTDPFYSNSISHGGGGALGVSLDKLKPKRKANTYEAVHEAVSGLARHVMWSTAEPLDVVYNENYNNMLAQSHAPHNHTLSKTTRVRSQITTWYHMRRCYDEFLNIESRERCVIGLQIMSTPISLDDVVATIQYRAPLTYLLALTPSLPHLLTHSLNATTMPTPQLHVRLFHSRTRGCLPLTANVAAAAGAAGGSARAHAPRG